MPKFEGANKMCQLLIVIIKDFTFAVKNRNRLKPPQPYAPKLSMTARYEYTRVIRVLVQQYNLIFANILFTV